MYFLLQVIVADQTQNNVYFHCHSANFAREGGNCARLRSFSSPFDVQVCATRSDFFPFILPSLLLILQFITPGWWFRICPQRCSRTQFHLALSAPTCKGTESVAGVIGIDDAGENANAPYSCGNFAWNDFIRKCSGSIVMRSTVIVPGRLCQVFFKNNGNTEESTGWNQAPAHVSRKVSWNILQSVVCMIWILDRIRHQNSVVLKFSQAAMSFSNSISMALRTLMAPALQRGLWLSSIAAMLLRAAQAYSIWLDVANSLLAKQRSGLIGEYRLGYFLCVSAISKSHMIHSITWKYSRISLPPHGAWSSIYLPEQLCNLSSLFLLADLLQFGLLILQNRSTLEWRCTAHDWQKQNWRGRKSKTADRVFI